MDKTALVQKVAELFRVSGCKVDISVKINHREIDIRAEETQGLARKIILIECADYATNVGVDKVQEDIRKLRSAKEQLKDNAVLMHIARIGYTPDAMGYMTESGILAYSLNDLEAKLINFDAYIDFIEKEPLRQTILQEYQPNDIHYDHNAEHALNSIDFLDEWLSGGHKWLTLLGDYGVGKSWTLRRFLYYLIEKYKKEPSNSILPFFIPLHQFTKAFDFGNLMNRTLHLFGLSGVHFSAFEYLMQKGKILFLFDAFDEMAQHLSRDIIRENLKELLVGVSTNSRAIMTSRPNYFDSRSERFLVVEKDGLMQWHPLDQKEFQRQNIISRSIKGKLAQSQFARINDLSIEQRKRLFRIVLGANSPAYKKLIELFTKYDLEKEAQRPVIARLLTTVAETLATGKTVKTIDGYDLLPDDLKQLNQAKIFEIVIYNLLQRDHGIGPLKAAHRLRFLRTFALYLQRSGGDSFAEPHEIKEIVRRLFKYELDNTDTPAQLLENYYRTCRRHSGLTTERQFSGTSGNIDFPVDESDNEARVGFSHNSLREYLVAEAFVDYILDDNSYPDLLTVSVTSLIADFVVLKAEYEPEIITKLSQKYLNSQESRLKEKLFRLIFQFIQSDSQKYLPMLGNPPMIQNIDLSGLDLSTLPLAHANITGCIALETDFRKSDLKKTIFKDTIIEKVTFDEAMLIEADFRETEIISIYVYDEFDTETSSVLFGRDARQWLYSKGALVHPISDLNPLMGKPWYEAAREVTKTLEHSIAGTHQDVALYKGIKLNQREFAKNFVEYLMKKNILEKIVKSDKGPGWVVKVNPHYRHVINSFCNDGKISPELEPFFKKHLPRDAEIGDAMPRSS